MRWQTPSETLIAGLPGGEGKKQNTKKESGKKWGGTQKKERSKTSPRSSSPRAYRENRKPIALGQPQVKGQKEKAPLSQSEKIRKKDRG